MGTSDVLGYLHFNLIARENQEEFVPSAESSFDGLSGAKIFHGLCHILLRLKRQSLTQQRLVVGWQGVKGSVGYGPAFRVLVVERHEAAGLREQVRRQQRQGQKCRETGFPAFFHFNHQR